MTSSGRKPTRAADLDVDLAPATTPASVPVSARAASAPASAKARAVRPNSGGRPAGEPEAECAFQFDAVHRHKDKLLFATAGRTGAGKTHWLCSTCDRIDEQRFLRRGVGLVETAGVAAIRSQVAGLKNAGGVQATRVALPEPILLSGRVRSWPWLRSADVLASVSDYAGEAYRALAANDPEKLRMLQPDGYLYFFDPGPTEPGDAESGGSTRRKAELQFAQLRRLCDELEGVHRRRPVRIPLAFCLTKIDRLALRPADGGSEAVVRFLAGLRALDAAASGRPAATLRRIDERSRLTAELMRTLWRQNVEEQIDAFFGRFCRFFPMTSTGFADPPAAGAPVAGAMPGPAEPAYTDEPLLWLMHMNGYPVLRR